MAKHQRTIFYQLTVVEFPDGSREFRSQLTTMIDGKRTANTHNGCETIQHLEDASRIHEEFQEEIDAALVRARVHRQTGS